MSDNDFLVRIQKIVTELCDEVDNKCSDPYKFVSMLYNTEMYICQLFGQRMERHLDGLRRIKNDS